MNKNNINQIAQSTCKEHKDKHITQTKQNNTNNTQTKET